MLLTVLDAQPRGRERPVDAAVRALAGRRLLVFDNTEHVTHSCALLVDELVRACPGLDVLVASRRPLNAAGETRCEVPPLAAPDAVELFVRRAGQARPHPGLSEDELALVPEVCRRLDGLPLAIELAAGRIRSLPLAALLERLSGHPGLLRRERPGALPHQFALETTIGWSLDQLTAKHRLLLGRLAAFAGPFSLDAAEQVAGHEPLRPEEVAGPLGDLVEHSLVQLLPEGPYRLLTPIRECADAQAGPAERLSTRAWHLDRYAELAGSLAEAAPEDATASLAVLRAESAEVLAGLAWSLAADAPQARLERGVRLLTDAGPLWHGDGMELTFPLHWTTQAWSRAKELPDAVLSHLHQRTAWLVYHSGRRQQAYRHFAKALELLDASNPWEVRRRLIDLHLGLGAVATDLADSRTLGYAHQTADLARRLATPKARPADTALAVVALAEAAHWLAEWGRYDEAAKLLEDARALAAGDLGLARTARYGELLPALRQGHYDRACEIAVEMLADPQVTAFGMVRACYAAVMAAALRGRHDDARAAAAEGFARVARSGHVSHASVLDLGAATLEHLAGNADHARRHLVRALNACLRYDDLRTGVHALNLAAEVLGSREIAALASRAGWCTGLPPWPFGTYAIEECSDGDHDAVAVAPALARVAALLA